MTLSCMRILARTGSSCPALYPPLLRANGLNGLRVGGYNNWTLRATARSMTTMLYRKVSPEDEPDNFIPDLRDSIIEAIHKPGITKRRYILFQATPSYSHLVSDPIFLRESIDRAVKTAGFKIERIEAAGVIVDNIPQTRGESLTEGWSLFVTDRTTKFYGDTTAAFERFEYHPRRVVDFSIDLRPNFPMSRNPDDDRGTLQMAFQTADTEKSPQNEGKKLISRKRERLYVKTKLANTIFQNGMPATAMVHMYRVEGEEDGSNTKLFPELLTYTKDLTIRLSGAQVWEARVNYRLRQLTPTRRVSESVGNILKRLMVSKTQVMPASQELEAAVARLTLKRPAYDPVTLEKHPIEVFAQISPFKSGELGMRVPQKGVRYAKVLAGGGGWGDNAGILALDPGAIEGEKVPGGFGRFLQQLGDSGPTSLKDKYITFFASDPVKSSARGRGSSSMGMWRIVNTGKDYPLALAGTVVKQTPIEAEPTEKAATNSTEGTTIQPAEGEEATDATKEAAIESIEKGATASTEKEAIDQTTEATIESSEKAATDPTEEEVATEGAALESAEKEATESSMEQVTKSTEGPAILSSENAAAQPTEKETTESTKEEVKESTKEEATESTEKATTESSEQTPTEDPQTNEAASALREWKPKKHNTPAQILQIGTETGIWINGNKMDVPQLAIMLDLLQETGEIGGNPTIARYVGMSFKDQKRLKLDKRRQSRLPYISLSLMDRAYDYEAEKYVEELERARNSAAEEEVDVPLHESSDSTIEASGSEAAPSVEYGWATKPQEESKEQGKIDRSADEEMTALELGELYKQRGQAAEVEFAAGSGGQGAEQEAGREAEQNSKAKEGGDRKDDHAAMPSEPVPDVVKSKLWRLIDELSGDTEIHRRMDRVLEPRRKREPLVEEDSERHIVWEETKKADKKDDTVPPREA
ncbi:hypothetical protein TWF281_005152 [Arthrobotrys megalospora]